MDWPKSGLTTVIPSDLSPSTNPDSHNVNGWYVEVKAHASANTKGSYFELIAATSAEGSGILLFGTIVSSGVGYLMDIAVGAAGSEQVILPNLPIQTFRTSGSRDYQVFLPVKIRRGARVSARLQASSGGAIIHTGICVSGDPFAGIQGVNRWKDYGIDLTASTGSSVTTSNSSTPTWKELVATTDFNARWAILCKLNGGSDDYMWDFGIGTTPVWRYIRDTQQGSTPLLLVPWSIPKGSQIQARCRSVNGTTVKAAIILGG